MESRRQLAWSAAASLATVFVTVCSIRGGRAWVAPAFTVAFIVLAAAVSWLPSVRSFAGTSAVFAVATLLFIFGDEAVARGSAGWWPIQYLGFDSLIWIPVGITAFVAEALLPRRWAEHIHPSSAVAAAAFMIVPTIGTDVITTYDSPEPALAAALVCVILQSQQFLRLSPAVRAFERIVEPFAVVIAGWAAAYFIGSRGDVSVGDLRWQVPLLALPAATAALVGAFKTHKLQQQQRAA